jgi:hypothetical protein
MEIYPDLPPGHPCRGQSTSCFLDGPTYGQQLGDKLSDAADAVMPVFGQLFAWAMMIGLLIFMGLAIAGLLAPLFNKSKS